MKANFLQVLFTPLIIISLFAVASSYLQNEYLLANFESSRVNLGVVLIFLSIAISYTFIYKKAQDFGLSFFGGLFYAIIFIVITVFISSNLLHYYHFTTWNLNVAFYQSILASTVLIFNIIFWKLIYRKAVLILTFNRKFTFYAKILILLSGFLSSIIFLLSFDFTSPALTSSLILAILPAIALAPLGIITLVFVTLWLLNLLKLFKHNVYLLAISTIAVSFATCYVVFGNLFRDGFISTVVLFSICTFLTISLLTILVYFEEKASNKLVIKNLKHSFSQKEAQYLQLKHQISPHFLFNNLNTLISLIDTCPHKAVEFGHNLSNVYRYHLKSQPEDFVPLEDELGFIENYLEIYKSKFESGFCVEFKTKIDTEFYILSNALQEVVDNIFKHNFPDDQNPIIILIQVFESTLLVSNSIRMKETQISNKSGLENIRKRYELLTKNELVISHDAQNFSVTLPLLLLDH